MCVQQGLIPLLDAPGCLAALQVSSGLLDMAYGELLSQQVLEKLEQWQQGPGRGCQVRAGGRLAVSCPAGACLLWRNADLRAGWARVGDCRWQACMRWGGRAHLCCPSHDHLPLCPPPCRSLQVALVPAVRDATHHPLTPAPPLALPAAPPGLHALQNPASFTVDAAAAGTSAAAGGQAPLLVAAASGDVLRHLSGSEMARSAAGAAGGGGDRLAALASHLLGQRSFYPLFPPHPSACLDLSHDAGLRLQQLPHLLVLPSDLAPFAKAVCPLGLGGQPALPGGWPWALGWVKDPRVLGGGWVPGEHSRVVVREAGRALRARPPAQGAWRTSVPAPQRLPLPAMLRCAQVPRTSLRWWRSTRAGWSRGRAAAPLPASAWLRGTAASPPAAAWTSCVCEGGVVGPGQWPGGQGGRLRGPGWGAA